MNVNRKNWVFTQYLDQPHNLHFAELPEDVTYIVYQEEICPTTKRKHFQGYIQCAKRKYMSFLKRLISPNVHLEVQRAEDSDKARLYCMKEKTRVAGPWELGDYAKVEVSRTDITHFRDAILKGATEHDLWMDYCPQMSRYPRMFKSLYTYGTTSTVPRVIPRRCRAPFVTVLVGPTGCGKTRFVYDRHDANDLYSMPLTEGFWLDGYAGHTNVLIDEFTGNMRLEKFLQLIDRYAIRVACKGGFLLWNPQRIYITSNIDPREWYEWVLTHPDGSVKRDRTSQRDAMFRRITFIYRAVVDGPLVDVTMEYK